MKNLSKEEPHKVYFRKEPEVEESVHEAVRDLKPLDPFVISGGENTERFYFKAVSELTPYHFKVLPEYFGRESQYVTEFPSRIKMIADGDPDAKIFCVFDLDTIASDATNQKNYEKFKLAIRNQIDSGSVTLCPSMPCFEYWLLLHFENTTIYMKNNARVTSHLSPYMKPLFPKSKKSFSKMLKSQKYLENMDWKALICSNDNLKRAIATAKNNYNTALAEDKLGEESYTLVFKAFEKN